MWRSRVTVISCEGAGICGCAASRHAEPRRFIDSGRGNFRMRIVWTGCADAAGHCGTFWWLTPNSAGGRRPVRWNDVLDGNRQLRRTRRWNRDYLTCFAVPGAARWDTTAPALTWWAW